MSIHGDLLDASQEIGDASEMAHWAYAGLVAMVEATGKPVNDLTVGELRAIIARHDQHIREVFNEDQKAAA